MCSNWFPHANALYKRAYELIYIGQAHIELCVGINSSSFFEFTCTPPHIMHSNWFPMPVSYQRVYELIYIGVAPIELCVG